jgi:hypothetical protein
MPLIIAGWLAGQALSRIHNSRHQPNKPAPMTRQPTSCMNDWTWPCAKAADARRRAPERTTIDALSAFMPRIYEEIVVNRRCRCFLVIVR